MTDDPNPKAYRKYGFQAVTDNEPPTRAPEKPPAPRAARHTQIESALRRISQLAEWPLADLVDAEATMTRIGVCAQSALEAMGVE